MKLLGEFFSVCLNPISFLNKKGGYPSRGGYYALKLFEKLGLIRRAGTKGKAFLYELIP